MANVTQRVLPSGKKRWVARYSDNEGVRRYKNFDRKKDADAFLDEVKRQLSDGVFVHEDSTTTVAEAADQYLNSAAVRALEGTTQSYYSQHVKRYIKPTLGRVKLTKLTDRMVYEFLDEVHEECSATMANRALGTLNRIIKEAQRRNLVGRNVIVDKSIKGPRSEPFDKRMPEQHELTALLAVADGRARTLLMTAMFTGMRLGELRALTWDDVLLEKRIIRVRKASRANGSTKSTKSAAGRRDIPISVSLGHELKIWRLRCPVSSKGLVFPNGNGNHESGSNIRNRIFIPAMSAVGLTSVITKDDGTTLEQPAFRIHDLRHAAAALFIEQGMGPKRIQELMGHSSIQTTFDRYGYLFRDPEADAAAVDAISARVMGGH